MKSKFRYTAYLIIIGCVFGTGLLVKLFFLGLSKESTPLPFFACICLFFSFIWIWIFFGEVRTKVISLGIEKGNVYVKRYFGLGIKRIYSVKDLSGFYISNLPSKGATYEYLYLMLGNKKIAKVSEFYHSNYASVKHAIMANGIKNLGTKPFSNREELKDVFSK